MVRQVKDQKKKSTILQAERRIKDIVSCHISLNEIIFRFLLAID